MPTFGTASAAIGVISMLLLTAVVVLGISVDRRVRVPGLPAVAGLSLHRFVSLLAVGFLALHILTAVLAPYARVGFLAAIVPFATGYESGWIALGAVAFDLMVALIVTSLLRRYISRRTWRAVHWLAYACWPAAFAHSIGTGGGMRAGRLLDLAIACGAAVVAAAGWRLAGPIAGAVRTVGRPARQPASSRPPEHPAPLSPILDAGVPVLASGPPGATGRRLRVDPVACSGFGFCAELLPELISLDQWGYPMISAQPVPSWLTGQARHAVTFCPRLALLLTDDGQ
jgi:ferredoxin